jgi:hypothetical protein
LAAVGSLFIGPTSVASSNGSPSCQLAATFSTSSRNGSCTSSCTSTRSVAQHTWPAQKNPPKTAPCAARSRSASSQTITGLLPLASISDRFRPAVRTIFSTVACEPSNPTQSIELAAGDWYIVPTVRADAILTPLVIEHDDRGELEIRQAQELRRVPISTREKLSASPPINLSVIWRDSSISSGACRT